MAEVIELRPIPILPSSAPGTLATTLPGGRTDPALLTATAIYSFAELESQSRRAAIALARWGVRKGTHVGLLLPNGPDWLVLAWAVWRLGAVLVPLNTFWTGKELVYALQLADVRILVATPRFLKNDYAAALAAASIALDRKDACATLLPCLATIVWFPSAPTSTGLSWQGCQREPSEREQMWLRALAENTSASEPAAIFFTSGSEAAPKAVVHSHASMLAAAAGIAERLGLERTDRVWAYLPWFFAGGLVAGVLAPWLAGAAVISQPVFEPGEAIALMERYEATTFFAWPHQAHAILKHPSFCRARLRLRKGPGAQADWADALYGNDHHAVSTWGMTETGPMAATTAWSDPIHKRKSTHGRPLPGVEMKVLDPNTGVELPPGQEGELAVRGATLMLGYYKRRPRECFDSEGFFHTGDRAWIDDEGYLHFTGRIRDVVKVAGASVSPAEVEFVLAAYPGVRTAVVVGAADPERGQRLVAFVVPEGDQHPSEPEVIAWCRERLATYKVPERVFFLTEHELPVLGSGKIHRQALAHKAEQLVRRTDSSP
ncbi:MAG: acyl--CoA ligase [Candidatus Binatia bacterium]|nr:acyl--CoA ligase [Candidatus Binatia bacterium]